VQGLDEAMVGMGRQSPLAWIQSRSKGSIPERLATALVIHANVPSGATGASLTREQRRSLATMVAAMDVPITGDRGYNFAEVTAGGVPLSEVQLATMESRVCSGLHLCGEICDVDGRVGGYNFQWAWASGYLAGRAAVGA
jgi:predicted flavoprotein YhiN